MLRLSQANVNKHSKDNGKLQKGFSVCSKLQTIILAVYSYIWVEFLSNSMQHTLTHQKHHFNCQQSDGIHVVGIFNLLP